MDCSASGSPVHGDSPRKNTGVVCHALLQGIFPTQGSNPGLPHWRQILYHPSQLDCLYFASELYKFLTYFGYKSLIRWLVWKYFLPFIMLYFYFADYFFCCTDSFYFDMAPFVYFCICSFILMSCPKNSLPRQVSMDIFPVFSSFSFIVYGLTFKSWMHLNQHISNKCVFACLLVIALKNILMIFWYLRIAVFPFKKDLHFYLPGI